MRKALTLMETLVATCVATMLLLEVGSSFLMFRQMNNESTGDAKNELKVLEIKDYITTNVDKFIDEALGSSYFRVDYDKIEIRSGEELYFTYRNGMCFLEKVPSNKDSVIVTLDTVLKNQTINHESIISFKLPEEYHDQPIYLDTEDGNKQVSKLSADDTLYYSNLVKKGINENKDFNLAKYKNNSLYINGEEIFSKLPFKDITIKLSFEPQEVDTYTVAEVKKGLETKYELLPFTIEVNDPNLGMVTIKDVDLDNHRATLEAHSFYKNNIIEFIDKRIAGEEVDINEVIEEIGEITEDIGEVVKDIQEGRIPDIFNAEIYRFDGWKGTNNKDFTYTINYLKDLGEDRKVVANFLPDTIEININEESEDISKMEEAAKYLIYAKDGSNKNTTVTKKVYILKCTIEYEDKNGTSTLPFTAGLFEKYLPEIYKGER